MKNISNDIISAIAVTSFVIVASIYLPIIGFFSSLFLPLPILFYRLKLGRTNGIIIACSSIIVALVISDGISLDMLFLGEMALLGFVMGELIEIKFSIEKTILYACVATLFTGSVILVLYGNMSQTNLTVLLSEFVSANFELMLSQYEEAGVAQDAVYMIASRIDQISYIIVRIIPAAMIASTLLTAWMNILVARAVFKVRNIPYHDFGCLNLWKAPEFIVWAVIACCAMILLPNQFVRMLGLNGLIVLMVIYFFQGIAIVSFYFEKKQFPRLLRIFLYSLCVLQQITLIIVIGLGFFDVWLNFRRLGINNNTEA